MSFTWDSWIPDTYSTPTSDGGASSPTERLTLLNTYDPVSLARRIPSRSPSLTRKRHDCPFNLSTCTGCQPTSPRQSDERRRGFSPYNIDSPGSLRIAERRHGADAYGSDDGRDPPSVREQLVEQLLQLHFPAGGNDADFMYTQFLSRDILSAAGPVMEEAVDILCLAEIGIAYHDRSLILEARRRYRACVANLLLDTEDCDATPDDLDSMLGAIYILEFCGFYPILHPGQGDRKALHQAMDRLLLARGSAASNSKLVQLLLYNTRHLDVMYGMVERKGSDRSRGKPWKHNIAITNRLLAELTEYNLRVPVFLERCDALLQHAEPPEEQVVDLIVELSGLESRFQHWLVRYYSEFSGLPYWQVSADQHPAFHLHTGHLLPHPTVFPKILEFTSFSQCSAQCSYWIALLNIKAALLDLVQHLPFAAPLDRRRMLLDEAAECADRLCASVPWILQAQHGTCGALRAMGPLHHAKNWYEKQGNVAKAAWCREVRRCVSERGLVGPQDPFERDGDADAIAS